MQRDSGKSPDPPRDSAEHDDDHGAWERADCEKPPSHNQWPHETLSWTVQRHVNTHDGSDGSRSLFHPNSAEPRLKQSVMRLEPVFRDVLSAVNRHSALSLSGRWHPVLEERDRTSCLVQDRVDQEPAVARDIVLPTL